MDIHYFHAASDQFQRRLAIWAVKVWAFCSRRILVWLHCPWRATTSALRLQFYRSETGRWGKCWRLLQEDCWVPPYSCFSACSGYQGRAYVHGDKTMNFQASAASAWRVLSLPNNQRWSGSSHADCFNSCFNSSSYLGNPENPGSLRSNFDTEVMQELVLAAVFPSPCCLMPVTYKARDFARLAASDLATFRHSADSQELKP